MHEARRTRTLKFLSTTQPPYEEAIEERPSFPAFGRTDKGPVRSENEDQFVVADLDRTITIRSSSFGFGPGARTLTRRQAKLLMVADGLGGHAHGEIAAAVVVDSMLDYLGSSLPWASVGHGDEGLIAGFEEAVRHAQERVFSVAARKKLGFHTGTTLTMAYVEWPMMYLAHVGDSRCYLHRDHQLWRLTHDHTMVERLVAAGISQGQAEQAGISHILVNAVGGGTEALEVDVTRRELRVGDTVLLCSNGLNHAVPDEELAKRCEAGANTRALVDGLVEDAVARNAPDNVTIVVMKVVA